MTQTPKHIAIVMDGNGRWAKQRFLPRLAGHKKGVDALRDCVKNCYDRGVSVLTVFAFSSENWARPPDEVSGLLSILGMALKREVPKLHKDGIRFHLVGDRSPFSEKLQGEFDSAEALTLNNTKFTLNVCFNYGGRWDMAQAAQKVQAQGLPLTEQNLHAAMSMAHLPEPDLIIRTGGEMRLSNFLLWQAAYAELFFSPALWPEFGAQDLDAALQDYAQRQRRFGKTSEQVQAVAALAK
jgi:undecaprenyl diphosphate synthase